MTLHLVGIVSLSKENEACDVRVVLSHCVCVGDRSSLCILTIKLIEVAALEQQQVVRVQFPDTVVFRRFG